MPDHPRESPPTSQRLLSGWKEIAAYLGKSPRSAMRYSTLPVHRKKLAKGESVFAFPSEIDAWLRQGGERQSHTRRVATWQMLLAAGVVVALASIVAFQRVPHSRPTGSSNASSNAQPAHWKVVTKDLHVLDQDGQTLWIHRFPFNLQESAYALPTQPWSAPGLIQITDLDRDGSQEVLIVATTVGSPKENRLYAFNADGTLRFKHEPPASVVFGETEYGAPFTTRYLLAANRWPSQILWAVSSHLTYFPTVIEKLGDRGAVVGRFWTNGHVTVLADVALGDKNYLAIGGTTNDGNRGLLVLLDTDQPNGATPSANSAFRCTSCSQLDPAAVFQFEPLDVGRASSGRPFVVEVQPAPRNRLLVTVNHGSIGGPPLGGSHPATAYYTVLGDLSVAAAGFGDDYPRAHLLLEGTGWIRHQFGDIDRKELAVVHRWNGSRFERMSVP